jgi:ribosomal protein L11 methyltransferase
MDRLKAIVSRLGLSMTVSQLPDVDYEESWKDSYPPQPIGKSLLVLPYWLADTDTDGRKPVILDPGLTFGTGAHPSTQMVMEAMEELVQPGDHCLDLGSGSGILSIAALRLGAADAIGIDIDPKAEDIAREYPGYNGFAAPEFTALTGNVTADKALMQRLSEREYSVVLVNIVADVIIGLAPTLPAFLTENSRLICSGILDTRLYDVTGALTAAGLRILQIRQKEDWRCVVAERSRL